MDAALTDEEIDFLQQLADAGAVGRIIAGLSSRAGFLRLVHLKYVTEQYASLDTVVYCITDAGRVALRKSHRTAHMKEGAEPGSSCRERD